MKAFTYVCLISIAVTNLTVTAMHKPQKSTVHTSWSQGQDDERKKLSESSVKLRINLRQVLTLSDQESSDDSPIASSSETENVQFFGSINEQQSQTVLEHSTDQFVPVQQELLKTTHAILLNTSNNSRSKAFTKSNPCESKSSSDSKNSPAPSNPYPMARLLRGLQVEWLLDLPLEKIQLDGIEENKIIVEKKQELIEHLRAAHRAIKHTLEFEDRRLLIQVNELSELSKSILIPLTIETEHPAINMQKPEQSLAAKIAKPAIYGGLGLVLGFMLAKKLPNTSL